MRTIILLALINISLIFANIFILVGRDSNIIDQLSRLPTAWGAFVGAVVGFIGVAWTAHKGFSNLIEAQEHRAKIEIKAREHQYKLDEAKYKREKSDKSLVVSNAILAELTGLLDRVHHQQTILQNQVMLLEIAKNNVRNYKATITMPQWSTPIWDNFTSDVGLLGASITADLIAVYSKCIKEPTEPLKDIDADTAITIYNGMNESNKTWCEDILHVSSRLTAFTLKKDDPGPLYMSSHRRRGRIKTLGQEAAEKLESRYDGPPASTVK